MNPLEELRLLEAEIDQASDLDDLRPAFYRLDEIATQHPKDFEVQLAVSDLRQRLLDRGNRLRKARPRAAASPPPAAQAAGRSAWPYWAAAVVVLIGAGAIFFWKQNTRSAANVVPVEIVTVPIGATVTINDQARCVSNCLLSLPPGRYQVSAVLRGYEQATSLITLARGKPASLSFPLEPRTSLRVFTDLDRGKVAVDDQPATDLMDGQFVLERVSPGTHSVKVTGRSGEASFTFEAEKGQLPVPGFLTARNMIALAVASTGNDARVSSNTGPLKLVVNGESEQDASQSAIELKNFKAGLNEFTLGEAKDQRTIKETFGDTPMVTVFLKSDPNIGTLIVSAGEDDVRVFVNGKQYRSKTQNGQVRIPAIGKVDVKVAKDGFEEAAPLTAEVKKGSETRLEFKLTPTPKTATLVIAGATPSAEVLIDQRSAGVVGADGSFSLNNVTPGNHVVELRREKYVPKRYPLVFAAGRTVAISGMEAILAAERLPPPPPPPEPKPEVIKAKAPPPPPPSRSISDFDDPSQWHQDNGMYVHRGAGFIAYKAPTSGVFTFTVQAPKGGLFHGGKVRWRFMYLDNRNYAEFEIAGNNFVSRVVQDGKSAERSKVSLKDLEKQKDITFQIDVTPEHIVHKVRSGSGWAPLDAWSEPGVNFADGKFGFYSQGNDEIELADFKFQPR